MTQLSDQPAEPAPQASTPVPDELVLAGEFAQPEREQWRELVAGVLRKSGRDVGAAGGEGASAVEDLLVTHLCEGIDIAPLYTAEDAPDASTGVPGLAPFIRGSRPLGANPDGWDVRARHADPDVAATAEAVLADLNNGVTSLWLVIGDGAIPVDGLAAVLKDVYLDLAPVALDAGPHTREAAEALFAQVRDRHVDAAAVSGTLGADPLGWLAGLDADTDVDAGLSLAGDLAGRCVRDFPRLRAVTVDAGAYHGAGADPAQELGCSLAAGVAYLRALTGAGLSVTDALNQLEFRYAASADQFTTIAKLRAARGLWARVAKECGVTGDDAAAQRQHAVSSESALTARDPWSNILRGTLGCFGAGAGGADAVTVLPFDTAIGLPDAFSRRIARNTQALLIMESHLARVVDPGGGSWYVESLTEALAQRAWEVFTGIERAGGLAAVLADGSLAETIGAAWREREQRLAKRVEPITGVSEFPLLSEKLPTRAPVTRPAPRGVLPRVRPAAAFEALRDRSDAHASSTGTRPAVFLAALGPASASTARAGFASNLFQAGGIDTPTGSGSAAEIAEAFAASGTTVACLCSSDKIYAADGAEVAAALAEAGAKRVLLAGPPGAVDVPGVSGHIFAGCDAIEVLTSTLDELGVSSGADRERASGGTAAGEAGGVGRAQRASASEERNERGGDR